jgi:hypothetical protein
MRLFSSGDFKISAVVSGDDIGEGMGRKVFDAQVEGERTREGGKIGRTPE